jgi:predicted polyphosphate/ATP-dependent NAD kinase
VRVRVLQERKTEKTERDMKRTIALIVNPVAGMGGSVGLKGTDGKMYKKALALGAKPVTPERTQEVLSHIRNKDRLALFVAPGNMGERHLAGTDMSYTVIGKVGGETSAEDTKRISEEMVTNGAELLVFVGGDGTARDIYDAIGSRIPVVAVPSGVKVFSSVFAVSARAASEMVNAFAERGDTTEEEVLDIDEDAFREGRLASRLYGYLQVPNVKNLLQGAKEASGVTGSAVQDKLAVAKFVVENMDRGILYLLGPGTTVKAIADELGVPKTLLGVDAVFEGKSVGTDVNEKGILDLFNKYEKRKIILTPIGGNGFILGRGSKQITPEVIKQVDRGDIILVGTRDKVDRLECLRVDTGELEIDELLSGYMGVTVGYNETMMLKVRC